MSRPERDVWADHIPAFVDRHYASLRGRVRTHVIDAHLRDHLATPPAPVVDVGGGAGTQSLPLARRGHPVMIVDPSPAMLRRAGAALATEPGDVIRRVTLVEADAEQAVDAVGDRRFAAVLCHGVISYLPRPTPAIAALCALARPGGIVSIVAKNAAAMAVRPALEGRWGDALRAFDARGEVNALGMWTDGDTVDGLASVLDRNDVRPLAWYGVRLFVEWSDLDRPPGPADVDELLRVEVEASRRDPYRRLSRLFHLVGRHR